MTSIASSTFELTAQLIPLMNSSSLREVFIWPKHLLIQPAKRTSSVHWFSLVILIKSKLIISQWGNYSTYTGITSLLPCVFCLCCRALLVVILNIRKVHILVEFVLLNKWHEWLIFIWKLNKNITKYKIMEDDLQIELWSSIKCTTLSRLLVSFPIAKWLPDHNVGMSRDTCAPE